MEKLSVRQLKICDFEKIVDYFLNSDNDFLVMMGVDKTKLPFKENWLKLLLENYQKSIKNKSFFYIIWLLNDVPVGHSNINEIRFGEEAHMHLHLWRDIIRQKGLGFEIIKMSLPCYFDNFKLQRLYCEPYAVQIVLNQICRFSLNKDATHLESREIFERNAPYLDKPTTGVIVDDYFYFIADTQGQGKKLEGVIIMKASLN